MKLNLYNKDNFSHYGDILAIPFFGLLIFYFFTIENKNLIEWILLLFSICGFLLDILYTIIFLSHFKLFKIFE
jgi:hypothetical protein